MRDVIYEWSLKAKSANGIIFIRATVNDGDGIAMIEQNAPLVRQFILITQWIFKG